MTDKLLSISRNFCVQTAPNHLYPTNSNLHRTTSYHCRYSDSVPANHFANAQSHILSPFLVSYRIISASARLVYMFVYITYVSC